MVCGMIVSQFKTNDSYAALQDNDICWNCSADSILNLTIEWQAHIFYLHIQILIGLPRKISPSLSNFELRKYEYKMSQ